MCFNIRIIKVCTTSEWSFICFFFEKNLSNYYKPASQLYQRHQVTVFWPDSKLNRDINLYLAGVSDFWLRKYIWPDSRFACCTTYVCLEFSFSFLSGVFYFPSCLPEDRILHLAWIGIAHHIALHCLALQQHVCMQTETATGTGTKHSAQPLASAPPDVAALAGAYCNCLPVCSVQQLPNW